MSAPQAIVSVVDEGVLNAQVSSACRVVNSLRKGGGILAIVNRQSVVKIIPSGVVL